MYEYTNSFLPCTTPTWKGIRGKKIRKTKLRKKNWRAKLRKKIEDQNL